MSLKPNAVMIQKVSPVEEANPTSGVDEVIHVKYQVLSAEVLQQAHHRAKYKFQKWKEEIEWKEYCEKELKLLNTKVFQTNPLILAPNQTAHSGDKSCRQAAKRNNVNPTVKIKEARQQNCLKKPPISVVKNSISKKGLSRTDQSRTVPYMQQVVQNKKYHDKALQTICHQIQEVQKDLRLLKKELSESRAPEATRSTVVSKDLVKKGKILDWCKMEEEGAQTLDGKQHAVLKRAVAHLVAKKAKKSPKTVGFLLPKHLQERYQLSHHSSFKHLSEQDRRNKKKKNDFHQTYENEKKSLESLRLIRDKAVITSPASEWMTKNLQGLKKDDVETFFTGYTFQKQKSENRNCQRLKNPLQHNWLHDLNKMWVKLESKEFQMKNNICQRWGEVCRGDLPTQQQESSTQSPEPILISKSSQPTVSGHNEPIPFEAKDVKLERQLPGIVFTKPDMSNKTRVCTSSSFHQPHLKGLLYMSSQQLEAIHSYKREYERYLRRKSFSLKGVENSVKLVEETAETLLNELMIDMVEELENLPDTCVSQLYSQEFVSDKTGAHLM
ncbi:uncharacterized protein LOC143253774 isoform X1 [Tachypleus tridentatus]|uniref:uncharacterized protein LOC143253774 isoform X1 n=1 Tax=Tachypleus tridentatus TaxID=6853 RepID=UPI003FD5C9DE